MAEDSSPPDKIKQLDDRVNHLEYFARQMAARLYAIGQGSGPFSGEVSGNPKTWTDELEAHLSRLSAIEAAVETTAPAEKPTQEQEPRGQITTLAANLIEKRAVEPALAVLQRRISKAAAGSSLCPFKSK